MSEYGDIERSHSDHGKGSGEGLKVFEKTWGHRVLMGLSICMFVGGVILAIYCAMRLGSVAELADASATYALAYTIYVMGFVMGVATIPPSILGVFAATHPKVSLAAVAAAVIALAIVVAFIVYAFAIGGQAFSIFLYAVLLAIAPVIYLVSALKVKRSA